MVSSDTCNDVLRCVTMCYDVGNKFTVEHLEVTDITKVMGDTIKDDVDWKPNKIEETVFLMTRKN